MSSKYYGHVDGYSAGKVTGWLVNRSDLGSSCTVVAKKNGHILATAEATIFRQDLKDNNIGSGSYGFELPIPSNQLSGRIDVVEKNSGYVLNGGSLEFAVGSAGAPLSGVCFDISDLVQYFQHNRAPTGIQRVQIEVVSALIEDSKVSIISMQADGANWKSIPKELFKEMTALAGTSSEVDDPAWRAILNKLENYLMRIKEASFEKGAVVVNLGTSWWIPSYFSTVAEAKRKYNIKYVPYIHDIIPLKVPEHCSEGLVKDFISWIHNVILYADDFLANSKQTASDLSALALQVHGRKISPHVCTLDAIPAFLEQTQEKNIVCSDVIMEILEEPFVLFVGTIESRKNHLFVFDAWLEMVRGLGIDNVPNLVCVGKIGWLNEAAMSRFENSEILQRKVRLLSNIGDSELAVLYKACRFTTYNSYYEGWGLPVSESLACGKVPLVADNTSLTEAGGELAVYFESGNKSDYINKFKSLLEEGFLRKNEVLVISEFKRKTWLDVALAILNPLKDIASSAAISPKDLVVAEFGSVYSFRKNSKLYFDKYILDSSVFRSGQGWGALEGWGTWSLQKKAALNVPINPTEKDLAVYIQCARPSESASFSVRLNDREFAKTAFSRGKEVFKFVVPKSHGNFLCVEFINHKMTDLSLESDNADSRIIGIGLISIMICEHDDLLARLEYVESFGKVTKVNRPDVRSF
ncbi:glycosyltransferase family 4 protein [Pseudomonas oryzihabitans]|uniref:glycosyltransferase family 4 protein n=1 Tax=Pseudomonas oryzihabitans TaxID=47885 RepID=UPI0015E3F41F|nr:glycosyltransferase family 1 protein [Pseudomonas psychrotolerans]MBA1259184.1 glycosyltransferase family 4 protein [Pseudomonas psychrotolerans]